MSDLKNLMDWVRQYNSVNENKMTTYHNKYEAISIILDDILRRLESLENGGE